MSTKASLSAHNTSRPMLLSLQNVIYNNNGLETVHDQFLISANHNSAYKLRMEVTFLAAGGRLPTEACMQAPARILCIGPWDGQKSHFSEVGKERASLKRPRDIHSVLLPPPCTKAIIL